MLYMLCCPVCNGTGVYEVAGGCLGQVYRCKDCGYRGSFVLEIDDPSSGNSREGGPVQKGDDDARHITP